MPTITVLAPDYEADRPAVVVPATRGPLDEPVTITLIENSKVNARELLGHIAAGLRDRLPVGDVVVHSKSAASATLDAEEAAKIAARSHLVISGLGD